MNKKILLLTPDFLPNSGGVAKYLHDLARYFSNDIEVFTSSHQPNRNADSQSSYPVYRISLLYQWLWPKWTKSIMLLWKYRKRYRLVFISHIIPFGTAAWLAKKFTGMPYIIFLHGMDIRLADRSFHKRLLAKKILKNAHLVVTNSQALAQEIAHNYGKNDLLVVYPCVDEKEESYPKKEPSSIFTIVTVARLVSRKGHLQVLNALAQLKHTNQLQAFIYHIVGEGPMMESLKATAYELGLMKEVIFHGRVTDLERETLYKQSDLFLMPVLKDSVDKEGFGIVFLEAARAGIPSISTNIGGVNEAIIHNETGILLDDPSPKNIANSILYLEKNELERMRMSEQAQEHAKKFTCSTQLSKLDPYV